MKEDLKEHLKVYDDKEENIKKTEFKELQTELLVIGEEWNEIETFKGWIEMALGSEMDSEDDDDNDD
ncbi:unnamed protein product [Rotaria sordida]|uniref:Uncharacterized protein n=1 Tax=Rotaria sordida TaxID=392033 RepID=A0A815UGC9_9BILA|nr:unnamed protein product [Rotaria sordida]CAF1517295.1 unnamed protein product [Rotaria sordida]